MSLYKKIIQVSLFTVSCITTNLGYSYQFDSELLKSLGIDNVDLSAFSGNNDQFAGEYIVSLEVNNNIVNRAQSVSFYTQNDESHLCMTSELMNTLPFKDQTIKKLKTLSFHSTDAGKCYSLEDLDNTITMDFNESEQLLNLVIPQLYLENYDPSWVTPKNRDYGISGLVFDYSFMANYNQSRFGSYRNSYNSVRGYGAVGANIGRFRFRGNYQYDSSGFSDKLNWSEVYAFTDIAPLNAKLYAGELYSRSNIFDSVRFKGISLFTDENMMPAYLQGYAPQVMGVASSNAIVTIRQYGNIVKSEQVPAGPFSISDLPAHISGTLDVEVEESNGEKINYKVDIAQVPFLTRKSDIRYNLNIGKLYPQLYEPFNKVNNNFISADASYGVTNNISLFGGYIMTLNSDYRSFNIGLGLNLESLGALSFDITQSYNKANTNSIFKGHSYRVNYAKRFTSSTTLNIAGYRFSSRDFTTLNNYIDMKSGNYRNLQLEKNRFTLSLSQSFPSISASVSASATKGTYWNRESMFSYTVGASKAINKGFFEGSSLHLSVSRTKSSGSRKDTTIGFSIYIPLDNSYNGYINYSTYYSDLDKSIDQQASYNMTLSHGSARIGVNTNGRRDFSGAVDYSLNGSYNIDTRYGKITTTANYSDKSRRVTAGVDGSVTLTQHGIVAHSRNYEDGSRLIVDADAPGVPIKQTDSVTNIFGLAGISNIPSYYHMNYSVDNDNIPEEVEVQDGVVSVSVADGSIAYRSLNAVSGQKAISRIRLEDGSYPPFGAVVYRENGNNQEVAMVAENGLTYLSGLNTKSSFVVKWGRNHCILNIKSLDLNELKNLICYTD